MLTQSRRQGDGSRGPCAFLLLFKRGRGAAALRDSTPGLDGLSADERRVLRLVSEYKTSKEIASLRNLSVRTIECHRAQICEKLELQGAGLLHNSPAPSTFGPPARPSPCSR